MCDPDSKGKPPRGFAKLDPERRREISRLGGVSLEFHQRSFSKDRALATAAGRKGGAARHGPGRRQRPVDDAQS